MKPNKRTILVTGASGLLGHKIVDLAQNDYRIVPFHHAKPLQPDSLRLDITNISEVLDLFNKFKPNTVIHTASETNVDKCETQKEQTFRINVEGARNIAIACAKENTKLIHISTDYVFDGEKGNYTEQDKPNPINYYGQTKLEGENQVIHNCKSYAILRVSVLYGWHPWKQNFATWAISQLKQGKEIAVVEDHYNTPTLTSNLAEMIIETAQQDLQGIYHASGSERISRYHFAKKIAEAFNLNPDLIKPVKMSQLTTWIAKRPRDSSLNTDKIQKQLKTKPLNITDGLRKLKMEAET